MAQRGESHDHERADFEVRAKITPNLDREVPDEALNTSFVETLKPAAIAEDRTVLESPFSLLRESLCDWITAQKAPGAVAATIRAAISNPELSPQQLALVDRALALSTESERILKELHEEKLAGGSIGAELFSSERAILIGRAYIYARLADRHPHLLSELVEKLSPNGAAKIPPQVIRERVLAFFEELRGEPESLMQTLITRELRSQNDTPVTCYLRGMLEPYFTFCRVEEKQGVFKRFVERFKSLDVPEQLIDLRDNLEDLDRHAIAFIKSFVNQDLERQRAKAYPGQNFEPIATIVRGMSDPQSMMLELSRVLNDRAVLSDRDLYFLIHSLPIGKGIESRRAHSELTGQMKRRLGLEWSNEGVDTLDALVLWKALDRVSPKHISDIERFSRVVSELKRAAGDTFKRGRYKPSYTSDIERLYSHRLLEILESARLVFRMEVKD